MAPPACPAQQLDTDVLRAVLVRTCASDHANLSKACRKFQEIISSAAFKQERCRTGFVEARVELKRSKKVDLILDGKKAGVAEYTLLARNRSIHQKADEISSELQSVVCTFFDRQGRPRLSSVKSKKSDKKAFLYLSKFRIYDEDYRMKTFAGAQLLRELLLVALKDKFSIAIYIPEAGAQESKSDEEQEMDAIERAHAMAMGINMDDDKEEQERVMSLTKLDMRQFFRAGFEQAKDAVNDSECFHVFATPDMLDSPLKSHQEVMEIAISEKRSPPRDPPGGAALCLLDAMKSFCSERTMLSDCLQYLEDSLQNAGESQNFRRMLDHTARQATGIGIEDMRSITMKQMHEIEQRKEQNVRFLQIVANNSNAEPVTDNMLHEISLFMQYVPEGMTVQQYIGQQLAYLEQMRELAQRNLLQFEQNLEHIRQLALSDYRRQLQLRKAAIERERTGLDDRVRSKIEELIRNTESANTIVESGALQACACNLEPMYVQMLLSFVPEPKKQKAINSLDQYGHTPLMAAAASRHFGRTTVQRRTDTCRAILDLGGDKNIADADGETALGKFRKSERDGIDFYSTFMSSLSTNPDFAVYRNARSQMEELLRPMLGPTTADEAYLEKD